MLLWLQGLFVFSLIWGLCGTITGESRKKFDTYFRDLLAGTIEEYPKPKSVKLSKVISVNPNSLIQFLKKNE